jgi:hypothetical protein
MITARAATLVIRPSPARQSGLFLSGLVDAKP